MLMSYISKRDLRCRWAAGRGSCSQGGAPALREGWLSGLTSPVWHSRLLECSDCDYLLVSDSAKLDYPECPFVFRRAAVRWKVITANSSPSPPPPTPPKRTGFSGRINAPPLKLLSLLQKNKSCRDLPDTGVFTVLLVTWDPRSPVSDQVTLQYVLLHKVDGGRFSVLD